MWNHYYTKIDAVMLIGSSKLILPKNSKENLTSLLKKMSCSCFCQKDNLTEDYENAHFDRDFLQKTFSEYCIILERDRRKIFDRSNHKEVSQKNSISAILNNLQSLRKSCSYHLLRSSEMHMTFSTSESQELESRCSLSALPNEIISKILKKLDLLTLCNISQVNKRLNNLTRDSQLYKYLNIRYICNKHCMSNIFCYFTSRCKYLQKLDLSFCDFFLSDFTQFLNNYGSHLTHLRLTGCETVFNNFALLKISKICTNLKELDLSFYTTIRNNGFLHLENLNSLEHLNLTNTLIDSESVCKVLRRNQRLRELNLKNSLILNIDAILTELKSSCQDLEIINLNHTVVKDITILADCKNLRKIDLHILGIITESSLCKLFFSCQRLEEIHLSDYPFHSLMDRKTPISKTLIKLCLNIKIEDLNEYSILIEHYPKLQEFHVPYANSNRLTDQWKKEYPKVFPLTSFCHSTDEHIAPAAGILLLL